MFMTFCELYYKKRIRKLENHHKHTNTQNHTKMKLLIIFSFFMISSNSKIIELFKNLNFTSLSRFQDGFSFGGIENGYGCWCYFEDSHGQGKGVPRDQIDENCKILHDGYDCVLLDHQNCVPWDVSYVSLSTIELFTLALQDTSSDAIMNDCEIQNAGNACAIDSCKVEQFFAYDYVKMTLANSATIDASLQHPSFDTDECTIGVTTTASL